MSKSKPGPASATARPYPELWEQLMGKCVSFNGLMHKTCDAGIVYESVKDLTGPGYRVPCLLDRGCTTTCASAVYLTEEQAKHRADEILDSARARMQRMADGICPHCDAKIERKSQVGSCVYADPCGCRLYTGRA